MDKNLLNTSYLESFLYDEFARKGEYQEGVSYNTFVSALPLNISDKFKDMVVIDCGTPIFDVNAYGKGVATLIIYTKPMVDGQKDIGLVSELETRMRAVVDKTHFVDKGYVLSCNKTFSDFDGKRNLFMNVWILNITII